MADARWNTTPSHLAHAALEASTDGVAILDGRGTLIYVNRAHAKLFGYESPSRLIGYEWKALYQGEERERVEREIMPALRKTGRWRGEAVGTRRDGSTFPEEVCLTRLIGGGAVCIDRDISDRKRAEDALRFLAEATRAMAGSLDYEATLHSVARLAVPTVADWCAVDLLDEDHELRRVVVAHADPEHAEIAERARRYPPDIETDNPAARVLRTWRSEVLPRLSDPMLRALARNDEHLRILKELNFGSGMVVPLVAHERMLGVMVFKSKAARREPDAADLQLAEELARRAAVAVEHARLYRASQQAIQVRDEVLRIVSHDLKSPLSAIAAANALIRTGTPASGRTLRHGTDMIEKAVLQMNRLISDLLDAARVEAGRLVLEPQPHAPVRLVGEARRMHRWIAQERGLSIDARVARDLPRVEVDRARVQQLFANLIGNAIKFTPAAGRIQLRAAPDGDAVRFTVADTGCGIAREELPHLFERFWQARHARRAGAGLGLAICKGIVEGHGGRIWAESAVGTGTEFHFTLPVAVTDDPR